jgi:hypothetical protein
MMDIVDKIKEFTLDGDGYNSEYNLMLLDAIETIESLRQQLAEQTSGEAIKVTRGSDGRLLLTQPDGKYFDVNEAIGKTFFAKGSV